MLRLSTIRAASPFGTISAASTDSLHGSKTFRYTYLNHYRFGQIIIDRFAAYAGYKFKFEMEGFEQFRQLTRQPEGIIT